MNAVQLGYSRDKQLVRLVEDYRALNTEQVTVLLFPGKAGQRKAQERCKKLADSKRLKRTMTAPNTPYIYYPDKRPGQLEHLLAVNWVRIWFTTRLASWEQLLTWEYEPDYNILRADGFTGILNTVTQETRFWFVEVDRSENPFDKVEKYNRLYSNEGYKGRWWVKQATRFPGILVVTEHREEAIRRSIERDNEYGLRFVVRGLEDIRREAMGWRQSASYLPQG